MAVLLPLALGATLGLGAGAALAGDWDDRDYTDSRGRRYLRYYFDESPQKRVRNRSPVRSRSPVRARSPVRSYSPVRSRSRSPDRRYDNRNRDNSGRFTSRKY